MVAPDSVWEIVFLMVILKIPIVYLCCVIWYAIKAEPEPGERCGARPRARPDDPPPGFGRLRRRSRRRLRPGRTAARPAPTPRTLASPLARAVGWATMSDDAESDVVHDARRSRRTAETVAGYLAALAIFVS